MLTQSTAALSSMDFEVLLPKLIIPFLTLVGSWGGFPEAPNSIKKLTSNKFFKYLFMWLFILNANPEAADLALVAVLLFALLTESIKFTEIKVAQVKAEKKENFLYKY